MRDKIAALRLERHLARQGHQEGRDDDEIFLGLVTCEVFQAADDNAPDASASQSRPTAPIQEPVSPKSVRRRAPRSSA